MKKLLNNAGMILSVVVALGFFAARAQPITTGHANDFSSVAYFEPPHQLLMKSRLSGVEAQPQGQLLLIKQLKLETFDTNGVPEMIVKAPECVYDTVHGVANSPGHVRLETADGSSHVEGDGFLWRQADHFLTISNNVLTVIEPGPKKENWIVKQICLIALLALAGGGWLHAQANVTDLPKPTRAPTRIDSEHADFDLAGRHAVYRGNVRVDDPQMKLTCEELTADLPQSGGHIDHLVALTNVVMDSVDDKGQTNHATSDKAVYDFKVVNGVTNEVVTLTGNAKVESAQGWMTGEPIIWDRANNSIHAENQKMILRQSITTALVNTNAPAAKTNLPAGPSDLPLTKTNFPPGTIHNIDIMTLPQNGATKTQ